MGKELVEKSWNRRPEGTMPNLVCWTTLVNMRSNEVKKCAIVNTKKPITQKQSVCKAFAKSDAARACKRPPPRPAGVVHHWRLAFAGICHNYRNMIQSNMGLLHLRCGMFMCHSVGVHPPRVVVATQPNSHTKPPHWRDTKSYQSRLNRVLVMFEPIHRRQR